MAFRSYADTTRKINYGCDESKTLTLEQLNTGALIRIAEATEAMSSNYLQLQRDTQYYMRRAKELKEDNARMARRIAALQGVITKMKKKK